MKIRKLLIGSVAFVMLVSCNAKKEEEKSLSTDIVSNPVSASGEADSTQTAVITFTEEIFDFGKIKEGEKVSHDFKFKNTGTSDLIITSASPSCGCTVPDYPKAPISPGQEGKIHIVFDSEGKPGKQHKTVTILTNTTPNTKILTITGEVNPK